MEDMVLLAQHDVLLRALEAEVIKELVVLVKVRL
jgi:hypothetical protein